MSEFAGHRGRLIAKLDKNVSEEHEILEALLFNAIPRRNTNDIAHRLLAQFGSIKGVFEATMSELTQVKGVGQSVASYLFCIGVFYKKYYAPQNRLYPEIYIPDEFLKFAKEYYGNLSYEALDFYFLNGAGEILDRKRFTDAHEHHVVLDPTAFTERLIALKAEGVVAVHNHLDGELSPSVFDDEATSKIQVVCSIQNVLFCDHIIVVNNNAYSYYQSGRMKKISNAYSLKNLLNQDKEGK